MKLKVFNAAGESLEYTIESKANYSYGDISDFVQKAKENFGIVGEVKVMNASTGTMYVDNSDSVDLHTNPSTGEFSIRVSLTPVSSKGAN
jgi:hypothetical protein